MWKPACADFDKYFQLGGDIAGEFSAIFLLRQVAMQVAAVFSAIKVFSLGRASKGFSR